MKNRNSFPTKRSGFTLIELLVVISILGILVALLVPVAKSFIERSQGVACAANMRPLAAALLAYRGEHNGWFPPGYPVATEKIKDAEGNVLNPGSGEVNFNSELVPGYLDELPICPAARLEPDERKKFPDTKKRFQAFGGTYGINLYLLKWKVEAMPPPTWGVSFHNNYSASKMPFLLEVSAGSVSWRFPHQNMTLAGIPVLKTMGRNHGRGDTLNFMFLDGHMEAISRNDSRDVEAYNKSWEFPTNPNGKFQAFGQNGKYISQGNMSNAEFMEFHPR